jgi:hypothetical protein
MSVVAAPLALPLPARAPALTAALALGGACGALAFGLAASPGPAIALGLGVGLAAFGLAALAEREDTRFWANLFSALAAALALALTLDPARLQTPLAFASLALLAGGAARTLPRRRLDLGTAGLALALAAVLCAFNAWYVSASQDLEIADFMFYRLLSVAVGTLTREGKLAAVGIDLAGSIARDYSWAPALIPGFALAAFGLLSRAVYQGAIMFAYATPAALALGWAARDISGVKGRGTLAFATLAALAAYPFGLVVAARGMPDIGGLALAVLALRLADRLARALALPRDGGARLRRLVRRLSFSLALSLFALFLFRRWYAFLDVAILAAFAGEVGVAALRAPARFRWREAALAASLGALTLAALLAPILADWLPNPDAHDYARLYAAYRKTPAALAAAVGGWCGYAPLALAFAGALYLGWRFRFARLAFVSGPVAALLFLRVQSPYPHHLYLIAPFVILGIAAPLTLLFSRSRGAGLAALAALAALTATPLGQFAPQGWFPAAALAPAPRPDLAELARLKAWVDARATPDHKVCGLGSSYTFSGQLIDELWQLKADQSPLKRADEASSVAMTDVDDVDGPPNPEIKDCATILVGDPVQTHVIPSHQLTVTLPATEVLTRTGVGANYRATGEVFSLDHGVAARVFERTQPLTDADMDALATRWRAARASSGVDR